jgi:uncharacterized protein YaiI (UPF0178 family)
MNIFVDSDACPVKEEIIAIAQRHGLMMIFIGNRWLRGLEHPLITQVVAAEGLNAADDLIAEKIAAGDLVVTADVPLAARCIEKGALGIDHRGKRFDGSSMGMALAMRDLMTHLRDTGEMSGGGPAPYGKSDRSKFKDGLERLIRQAKAV